MQTDPFADKIVYKDSTLERVCITLLTKRLADQLTSNSEHSCVEAMSCVP